MCGSASTLEVPFELASTAINAYREAHTSRLKQLGLWQDGQTDEALRTRLDSYIEQLRSQPPELLDYEYGLPYPMRFAATEIKNLSLKGNLTFDTAFDNHDFNISILDQGELFKALKEAGFSEQ